MRRASTPWRRPVRLPLAFAFFSLTSSAALADPWRINGYNRLVDPGKPENPHNPMRTWLTLTANNKPYHWLWNSLIFRAGCCL